MNAERFAHITAQGGWVNLSARAKWRLSGNDRVRYLNGQITQDARLASPARALYACVTNVKGRIEGDVFFHADAEALFLDAEPDLREPLGLRLERYLIADDAELTDVTEAWQLWHRFGQAATAADPPLPAGARALTSLRLGLPGQDLWLPAASAFTPPNDALMLDEAEYEALRILRGQPRHPNELNAETFPQEAGLEERAMSFTKGCYIGQEILSRIKTTGKMPRQLFACQAPAEAGLAEGDPLLDAAGHELGRITSLTRHPETGQWVGLASVKHSTAQATAGTANGSVLTLQPLP